jgi:glutaredoxin
MSIPKVSIPAVRYAVYTMPNCPDCKNAKDLLERKGFEKGKGYEEVTEFTPAELIAMVGPVRSLPQIVMYDLLTDPVTAFHVGGYKDLTKLMSGDLTSLRKIG